MTHSPLPPSEHTLEKEVRLKSALEGYGRMALAYSGGVDSTYLADVAYEVIGHNAHLLLNDSPNMPRSELAAAIDLAHARRWNLTVIHTAEFASEAFLRNDLNRCYVCKTGLFDKMAEYARTQGITVLAHGENADDMQDTTRTGHLAAVEKGAVAPLKDAELTKEEIRWLSARRNLPTWQKPSLACLSTRFPTGTRIDPNALPQIEQVEETLKALGFRQYRARHHGDLCRIEIDPADFDRALDRAALDRIVRLCRIEIDPTDFDRALDPAVRDRIVRAATAAGYRYVTLDLKGYGAQRTQTEK